jgi:Zn-dependent protease
MSPERVRLIVVGMIIFILSVAVHEFGHAKAADRMGDRLPRSQGRVTLNPMAHADPLGTLFLPFFFLATTGSIGFAWGKPVEHLPHDRFRTLIIAFAGPAMNVVLATIAAAISIALPRFGVVSPDAELVGALHLVVLLNFSMFFFNLLPASPLDGGAVVRGLIPESWVDAWDRYSVYAPFVLLAFLLIPRIRVIVWRPAFEATTWILDLFARLFGMS